MASGPSLAIVIFVVLLDILHTAPTKDKAFPQEEHPPAPGLQETSGSLQKIPASLKQLSGPLENGLKSDSSTDCRFPTPDIINGNPSRRGRWPWIVALDTDNYGFRCGGSLIDPRWMLTAAHCFNGAPEGVVFYARVGAFNLTAKDESERIEIEEIIIHPDYDSSTNGKNDMALLRLKTAANVSDNCVQPISMPTPIHNFNYNVLCWIIGWGSTEYGGAQSPILMERWVRVLSNDVCSQRWPAWVKIHDSNICVDEGEEGDISACYGDSGSPLQCYLALEGKWAFAGLSSYGSSQCRQYPSVYMRVSSYLAWIRKHVDVFYPIRA